MLRAIALALAQSFSGGVLRLLAVAALLSVACFAAIWLGLDLAARTWLADTWFGGRWSTALGGFAVFVLAWFLFPVVASAFVGLFLDHVATLVERRHHPHLPPARGLPPLRAILVGLRFLLVVLAANALLLVLLFAPPVYAVAWFVVNGWLVGREYFELVAMRRSSPAEADAMRRRHGIECLATGTALAALLAVPGLNLVLPIFGTAVMVHRYHDWLRADERAQAGGG